MRIEDTAVHCLACKHEWLAQVIVDAPAGVWAASVKALHCPSCAVGAKSIAFGRGDVPDPQQIQTGMTDPERRAAWLKLHDNGLSSECIAEKMCGLTPTFGDYPRDGDDFGRCERLLMLYPEWRARFGEMVEVSPVWAALVPRWDDLVVAWKHDCALVRYKPYAISGWRFYPLIRSIINPVESHAA